MKWAPAISRPMNLGENCGLGPSPRSPVKDDDRSHMTVFASSTVTQVQSALQMTFARVIGTDGREYTSAITPPSLPTELGDSVVGIRKLQPHLRPFHAQTITPTTIGGYISPTTIAQLYNASGSLGRNRANHCHRGLDTVTPSDLTAFWQACGLPPRWPSSPKSTQTAHDELRLEETMDIEWASAMAPGARIVYFSSPILTNCSRAGQPDDLQFSQSGQFELPICPRANRTGFAVLCSDVALGVTNFNASGTMDQREPSVPDRGAVFYTLHRITAPSYPSSDPYVTGVGGTYVSFYQPFPVPKLPSPKADGACQQPTAVR